MSTASHISATSRHLDRALTLVRENGLVRIREFRAAGIHHAYVRQLADRGELVRAGRGVYHNSRAPATTSTGPTPKPASVFQVPSSASSRRSDFTT